MYMSFELKKKFNETVVVTGKDIGIAIYKSISQILQEKLYKSRLMIVI